VLLLSLILLHSQWAWGETNIKNGKSPQAPAAISFQDGRLSANCEQLPLGLVLEELAQQASLTIYIAKSDASQKISAVFDALPLEQGIKRLLNGKDYALITAPLSADGSRGYRVATIRVLSKGQPYETIEGQHPAISPPARRSLTPEQQRQLEKLQHEVLEAPDAAKRITALEALADRPGGLAALANVVPAALRDGDSEVRETALSVMARMEGEMPVKSLIDMAHTDPEPNLRAHALTLLTVIDKDIALRHVKLALQDTAPHVSHVAMHLLQRSWPQETGQNNP
jgi:HEAT repeat protein